MRRLGYKANVRVSACLQSVRHGGWEIRRMDFERKNVVVFDGESGNRLTEAFHAKSNVWAPRWSRFS